MTERPAVAALRFNGSASFRPEGSQGRPYGMASGLAVSGRLPLAPRRQPKSQFYDRTPKSCRGLRRHISLQIYDRVSSPSTRNVGGSKFMLKLALRQNPGKCVPAAKLMTGVVAAQHFKPLFGDRDSMCAASACIRARSVAPSLGRQRSERKRALALLRCSSAEFSFLHCGLIRPLLDGRCCTSFKSSWPIGLKRKAT